MEKPIRVASSDGQHGTSRRAVIKASAWAVPAVALAAAVPNASASDTGTSINLTALAISTPSPNDGWTQGTSNATGEKVWFQKVLPGKTYSFTGEYKSTGDATAPAGTSEFIFTAGRAAEWNDPSIQSVTITHENGTSITATPTFTRRVHQVNDFVWMAYKLDQPVLPGDTVIIVWKAQVKPTATAYYNNPAYTQVKTTNETVTNDNAATSGDVYNPPVGWYAVG